MTHRSDDQSFEDTLGNAVRSMHEQMPRGNQPSSRAWNLIAEKANIRDQADSVGDTAARSASVKSRKQSQRPKSAQPQARETGHLDWSTWVAAVLVVALIAGSVRFLMPEGNDGGNNFEQSIALAPGTPDMSTLDPLTSSTPSATPDLYTPVHGPEFACTVEPMTEEQVYQIVLNPTNGYRSEDGSAIEANTGLFESSSHWMDTRFERDASESFAATDDQSLVDPIRETANTFWNCLMNGSALQVWSMMEPSAVQHEILIQHPVFRDEEMIRRHISVWGPRRYSASIYHVFPDLGDVPSYNASMRVVESYGAVRIGYTGDVPWKALVLLQSHPEASGYQERYLLLQRAPNGTWWVSMVFYE